MLAGLFGETACLSTLIEAYHRNHHFTYLTDASCSRGQDGVSAGELHRSVLRVGIAVWRKCPRPRVGWSELPSRQRPGGNAAIKIVGIAQAGFGRLR